MKANATKAYITMFFIIAMTSLSAEAATKYGQPRFCMKKYLTSLSLHTKASTNVYAQNQNNKSAAVVNDIINSAIGRRR